MTLDIWQSKDFTIVSDNGRKAPVRVTRISENIYEHPDPRLLKRSPSGMLSREQAKFDINALIYGLSEVHPNIFSVCRRRFLQRGKQNGTVIARFNQHYGTIQKNSPDSSDDW